MFTYLSQTGTVNRDILRLLWNDLTLAERTFLISFYVVIFFFRFISRLLLRVNAHDNHYDAGKMLGHVELDVVHCTLSHICEVGIAMLCVYVFLPTYVYSVRTQYVVVVSMMFIVCLSGI